MRMTLTTTLASSNPEAELTPASRTELAGDPGQPYRDLYEHMREGFAYCRMIFEDGEGCDFVYLVVNSAFENLTGLKNVAGLRATEAIPGIRETDPELLRTYARVAETGVPEKFERFVEALQTWLSVWAYCPKKIGRASCRERV